MHDLSVYENNLDLSMRHSKGGYLDRTHLPTNADVDDHLPDIANKPPLLEDLWASSSCSTSDCRSVSSSWTRLVCSANEAWIADLSALSLARLVYFLAQVVCVYVEVCGRARACCWAEVNAKPLNP